MQEPVMNAGVPFPLQPLQQPRVNDQRGTWILTLVILLVIALVITGMSLAPMGSATRIDPGLSSTGCSTDHTAIWDAFIEPELSIFGGFSRSRPDLPMGFWRPE